MTPSDSLFMSHLLQITLYLSIPEASVLPRTFIPCHFVFLREKGAFNVKIQAIKQITIFSQHVATTIYIFIVH